MGYFEISCEFEDGDVRYATAGYMRCMFVIHVEGAFDWWWWFHQSWSFRVIWFQVHIIQSFFSFFFFFYKEWIWSSIFTKTTVYFWWKVRCMASCTNAGHSHCVVEMYSHVLCAFQSLRAIFSSLPTWICAGDLSFYYLLNVHQEKAS